MNKNYTESKWKHVPIPDNLKPLKVYDINRWVFEIPLSDVQNADVNNVTDECICCGKKITNPKYAVHLLTNGNLVSSDQAFAENEDQGFFNIGSDCIKRLPNNFYFKL